MYDFPSEAHPQLLSATRISSSLTYEAFYGLHEKAFSLSADPRFLYRSPAHGPAFDAVLSGVRRREGLVVLSGEIGTGKTTLCRSVLAHLDRRTFSSFVADPFVSREDLLKTLLVDFGVVSMADLTRGRFHGASRTELSYPLYDFLDSLAPLQGFAVVVIDEAQNLSLPLLEEIRILSELERREKLLQVVLVGQPELRESLKLPQMRQVEQRVSVRCELTALDAEGTAGYVQHRLAVAGGAGHVEFSAAALEAVHRGSTGVPRLINRLCDRALERAHAARCPRVEASFVHGASEELGLLAAPAAIDVPDIDVPDIELPDDDAENTLRDFGSWPPIQPGQRPAELIHLAPAVQSPGTQPSIDAAASQLSAFAPASVPADRPNIDRGAISGRRMWAAGVAASLLAFAASGGAVLWYLQTQTVDAHVEAPLLPPSPITASRPIDIPFPDSTPAPEPAPAPEQTAVKASAEPDAARSADAPPAPSAYAIQVAAFSTRARADRLVEELTSAGYRAQAVEKDWGLPRGRLVLVSVGAYTSASDVQRDLQRIRELPGGFTDARIVERD
jgi:type II secretory pathway predicted ATPase ExeA/cell division septation protein DedD